MNSAALKGLFPACCWSGKLSRVLYVFRYSRNDRHENRASQLRHTRIAKVSSRTSSLSSWLGGGGEYTTDVMLCDQSSSGGVGGIGARLSVSRGSRRDPTSLAVGETCGKRRPRVFNSTPEGLNSTPSGSLRHSTYDFSSVGFTYG